MDRNEFLLTQNAGDLIRERTATQRHRAPGEGHRTPRTPRRQQLASKLRRIADAIDN